MNKQTKQIRPSKSTKHSSRFSTDEQIERLEETAPRFKTINDVVRGDNWELSQEQKEFLDEFKSRITEE